MLNSKRFVDGLRVPLVLLAALAQRGRSRMAGGRQGGRWLGLLGLALGLASTASAQYQLPLGIGGQYADVDVQAMGKDSDLNLYVAGRFRDNISLCGKTLGGGAAGAGLVAKFDGRGNCIWATKANGNVSFNSVTVDEDGNVFVAATIINNATFGSQAISVLGTQAALAKLKPDGFWDWVAHANTTQSVVTEGQAVSISPSKEIWFGIRIDSLNTAHTFTLKNADGSDSGLPYLDSLPFDIMILRMSPAGKFLTNFEFAAYQSPFPSWRGLFSLKDMLITQPSAGRTRVTLIGTVGGLDHYQSFLDVRVYNGTSTSALVSKQIGMSANSYPKLTTLGNSKRGEAFVTSWEYFVNSAQGNEVDSFQIMDISCDNYVTNTRECTVQPTSLEEDSDGNVYLSLWYNEAPKLGGDPNYVSATTIGGVQLPDVGQTSIGSAVVRLSSSLDPVWVAAATGTGSGWVTVLQGLATDARDGLYTTGYFFRKNGVQFYDWNDPNSTVVSSPLNSLPASGTSPEGDVLVAKLDTDTGTWQWATAARSVGLATGNAIVAAPSGTTYVAGNFEASLAFGPKILTAQGPGHYGFVQAMGPDGTWLNPESWTAGREIPRPGSAVAIQPEFELLSPGDPTDYFLWSPAVNKLYALKPGFAFVKWRLSTNFADDRRIPIFGGISWPNPADVQHISGAAVDLQPPGALYKFVGVEATESGATADTNNVFTAAGVGYSTLLFTDGPTGNPGTEAPFLRIIQSRRWTEDGLLLDNQPCTIGDEVQPPEGVIHDDPLGKTGAVLQAKSRIDGEGPDKAYDPATRRGQILPVNEDTAETDDDLVVFWYQKDPSTGIAWPGSSARYRCQWPEDRLLASASNKKFNGASGIRSVAAHQASGKVFAIRDLDQIYVMDADGSNATVVYDSTFQYQLTALAVDPIRNRLYVSVDGIGTLGDSILSLTLDLYQVETLAFLPAGTMPLNNLALDAAGGWLYFARGGSRVERLNVLVDDPQGEVVLDLSAIPGSGGQAWSLELDVQQSKLYYSKLDASTPANSRIGRINLDGSNLQTIAAPGIRDLYFDSNEKRLYWVTVDDSPSGTAQPGGLYRSLADFTGAEAFGLSGKNTWSVAAGLDGFVYYSTHHLVGSDNSQWDYGIYRIREGLAEITDNTPGDMGDVVTDTAGNFVYWSEPFSNRIRRQAVNVPAITTFFPAAPSTQYLPQALAWDASTSQLYWTDLAQDKIFRQDPNDTQAIEVFSGVRQAYGLTFCGSPRRLYWTETASSKIRMADPNNPGTPPVDVVTGLNTPMGLTCGTRSGVHRLYWADSAEGTIASLELGGAATPQIVAESLEAPRDVAVEPTSSGYLLSWADPGSKTVQRVDPFDANAPVEEVYSEYGPVSAVEFNAALGQYFVATRVPRVIVASQQGSKLLGNPVRDFGAAIPPRVYAQNDKTKLGYNPNEEHAFILGDRMWALRADLNDINNDGTVEASKPFSLLKYWDADASAWRFDVYKVQVEAPPLFTFGSNEVIAEQQLPEPKPLDNLDNCAQSFYQANPVSARFVDYKNIAWAAAEGQIKAFHYYPLQPGFAYDLNNNGVDDLPTGSCVPWLNLHDKFRNGTDGKKPLPLTIDVVWPTSPPTMFIGETVMKPKAGLPNITDQKAVQIIYDGQDPNRPANSTAQPENRVATIYDPLGGIEVPLNLLPDEILKVVASGGRYQIVGRLDRTKILSASLQKRTYYDPLGKTLIFEGFYDDSESGEPLLLPNVMTPQDKLDLDALSTNTAYRTAVAALYAQAKEIQGTGLNVVGAETKALTTGTATGTGYLTLAFNNDVTAGGVVSLKVISVECDYYRGDIKALESGDIFAEQFTLRHSGDFGGRLADPNNPPKFDWYYKFVPRPTAAEIPADGGNPNPAYGWLTYATNVGSEITIEGSGARTLSDTYWLARYTGLGVCLTDPNNPSSADLESPWAGDPGMTIISRFAKLAPGWVKRVTSHLNPFDSRVTDFHQGPTATYSSMVQQAGGRYEGDIAFNGDASAINSVGLIEAYTTILKRAKLLSVDQGPENNDLAAEGTNQAILLITSKLAQLYALLGNEALADALDPLIGFGSKSGEYGNAAPAIFTFMNQVPTLLDEELVLLRGRDDQGSATTAAPIYNRFRPNFTNGEGEVAYQTVYDISDQNDDGFINEADARVVYPQGHGDAWGHYLTALSVYYELLRHPFYEWRARVEDVNIGGATQRVDYLDERLFARLAAAKAEVGDQILDLSYRSAYIEDPAGQWQGYKDTSATRAWGVDEWARRTGQGAYFDWLTANAITPHQYSKIVCPPARDPNDPEDPAYHDNCDPNTPTDDPIQKIERKTITELDEIASKAMTIQQRMDKVDQGLNPLGLAKNVVPFDIDPSLVDEGETHFEQIYSRAVNALDSALTTFDNANQFTKMLRMNQDSLEEFQGNVDDEEDGQTNDLIAIFGTPYSDDIGAGKTYPNGYKGPDVFHYAYIDPSELTGVNAGPIQTRSFTAYFKQSADGSFFPGDPAAGSPAAGPTNAVKAVEFTVSTDGYGVVKPPSWTGSRRSPGELQSILSDIQQAQAGHAQAIADYESLLGDIQQAVKNIENQKNLNAAVIGIRSAQLTYNTTANIAIEVANGIAEEAHAAADQVRARMEAAAEAQPRAVGLATDATSAIRSMLLNLGETMAIPFETAARRAEFAALVLDQSKEVNELASELGVEIASADFEVQNLRGELQALMRQEPGLRIAVFAAKEAVRQQQMAFKAKLAEGLKAYEDLIAFRRSTAAEVTEYRYQDMAFRSFRNDALQKYRSQFDLAARYAYLAATAYDYETNLLGTAGAAGQKFLQEIVKFRSIGTLLTNQGGVVSPQIGSNGLADPMGKMAANFTVLKSQLGFNNPQTETNRFSMRTENFRLLPHDEADPNDPEAVAVAAEVDQAWRDKLESYRVPDLWQVREFKRYCRPFAPQSAGAQPGLVIPFSTTVTFGLNFFGQELGGGDSAYDPTQFATKVRSVGVWFQDYDEQGLSLTPRVYVVPVGADVLRSPTGNDFSTREWSILDQIIPVPFPIGPTDLADPDWRPSDSLSDTSVGIRRFSSLRAYPEGPEFDPDEASTDSRLIGRSVWNTKWLLIVPGGTLNSNATRGLDNFIHGPLVPGSTTERTGNGVQDIKFFFQTYAYSGN